MLKKHSRFFLSLEVMRDLVAVGIAFGLAYFIRFYTIFPYQSISPREDTLFTLALGLVTWPLMAWGSGVYRSWRSRSLGTEIFAITKVTLFTAAAMVLVTYFVRDIRYSRGVLVAFIVTSFVSVVTLRLAVRLALRLLRSRGLNLRRALIVGDGEGSRRVIQTINAHPELGLRVEGIITPEPRRIGGEVEGVRILGSLDLLRERLAREPLIDQVLVALPVDKLGALRQVMGITSKATVDVRLIPDLAEFFTLRGSIEEFGGLPIIDLQTSPLTGWAMVGKRSFDLAVGALCLLIGLPLMALIALGIKLGSRGPVIYRQVRMGMDGELFEMYKFRTMRLDAEAAGPRMATKDDTRTTRLGALLRRTSLDELPQLFNVLRGDMSLVGPRPERPCFIEQFRERIPRYHLRHKIKAGLTGLAQIKGYRGSDTSIAKRIEYDLFYIEKWSLALDFKILLITLFGGLFKNAY